MFNGQPLLVGSVLRMGNYTRDDDTTYDYSVVLFILESFSIQVNLSTCRSAVCVRILGILLSCRRLALNLQ